MSWSLPGIAAPIFASSKNVPKKLKSFFNIISIFLCILGSFMFIYVQSDQLIRLMNFFVVSIKFPNF